MSRPRSPRPLSAFAPEIALLGVVFLWASTFPMTKLIFAELSPLALVFARFALITVLAFGVLAIRSRGKPAREWWAVRSADLGRFAIAGLTAYTIYQLCFVLGLERTSPFSSSLLIAMMPLFTLIILAIGGERTPLAGWVGVGVALLGLLVFLYDKRGEQGTLVGDLLTLGAALSFAFYGVVNRPLVRNYQKETYTAYSILAGSVPLLLVSLPAALEQDWRAVSLATWVAVLYLVVLPVYVAYIVWNWAIARRGAALASGFTLLTPILAGLLSAVLVGEEFGAIKLAGALLVFAGLIIPRVALLRAPSE